MSENVETKGKIVNSEEFLAEFERVFGKNAEYFMAAAAMRTTPEVKMPEGIPSPQAALSPLTRGAVDEAEHRAEVFERMAFRLKEERELLVWLVVKKYNGANFCECDVCAYCGQKEKCINEDKFCACDESKECEECRCGLCLRANRFVFDPERAKKLKEKG